MPELPLLPQILSASALGIKLALFFFLFSPGLIYFIELLVGATLARRVKVLQEERAR